MTIFVTYFLTIYVQLHLLPRTQGITNDQCAAEQWVIMLRFYINVSSIED